MKGRRRFGGGGGACPGSKGELIFSLGKIPLLENEAIFGSKKRASRERSSHQERGKKPATELSNLVKTGTRRS